MLCLSQKARCACKEPKEPAVRGFGRGMYPLCFGPLCLLERQYMGRVLSESELNPMCNRDGRVARRVIALAGARRVSSEHTALSLGAQATESALAALVTELWCLIQSSADVSCCSSCGASAAPGSSLPGWCCVPVLALHHPALRGPSPGYRHLPLSLPKALGGSKRTERIFSCSSSVVLGMWSVLGAARAPGCIP